MARKKLTKAENKPAEAQKLVEFHYIKSNFFRVIRADGAFGGPTPNGTIHAAFFSERRPIPTKTVQPINEAGGLDPEDRSKREVRSGLVREVEVGVILDLGSAIAVHSWLGEKIQEIRKVIEAMPKTSKSE